MLYPRIPLRKCIKIQNWIKRTTSNYYEQKFESSFQEFCWFFFGLMNRQFSALLGLSSINIKMWPSKSEDFQNYIVTLFWNWHLIMLWGLYKKQSFFWTLIFQRNAFSVLKIPSIYADVFARQGSKRLDKE